MTDIYWDKHDVPHIYSPDASGLFYGFGRAVMRNHADLVLKLYAEARGEASYHLGTSFRASDLLMLKLGVWERARQWSELQNPDFRLLLEQFVSGINDYATENPNTIDPAKLQILPVSVDDVIAHYQRVFHITMMIDFEGLVSGLVNAKQQNNGASLHGSNAWALSADKTQEGYPVLMSSPHLPWGDMFRLFELHLCSPELNLYGVAPVGIPVLTMAFNDHLGWTHTVNKFQGWTLYELDLKPGGYSFDEEILPFNVEPKRLTTRDQDGNLVDETVTLRSSIHGPVIWAANGKAYSLKIAGLDNPFGLEQWWQMACAQNLQQFQNALERMQIPTFNVLYSDRHGHIMYFFNCQLPVLPQAATSTTGTAIPGASSATLWTQTYAYQQLPKCIDPPSGWLQNTNDAPWTCTLPAALYADNFPDCIWNRHAPPSLRTRQSLQLLDQNNKLSFDQVVEGRASRSSRLAQLLLDQLLHALANAEQNEAEEIAQVLEAWDRTIEFSSKGAVLFAYWAHLMEQQNLLPATNGYNDHQAASLQLENPVQSVAMLLTAAKIVRASYGSLDVCWCDVFLLADETGSQHKSALFSEDLLGVLSELWYVPGNDGRFRTVGGECFSFVVQFAQPVRASAILLYGNKTQHAAGGQKDQFDLYRAKKMRPVLRTPGQLEGQVAMHESFYNTVSSVTRHNQGAYEKNVRS